MKPSPSNAIHRRNTGRRSPVILAVLLTQGAALWSAAVQADLAELARILHPYAALTVSHDDNLFRVEGDSQALALLGDTKQSDAYTTLEAGFNTQMNVSQQRYLFEGNLVRNTYNHFDGLDHTGGNFQGTWQWKHGDLWGGEIGYLYNRRIRKFENQTTTPQNDMREENKVFADVDRWVTDRWRLGVLGSWSDVSFTESPTLNRERLQGGVGLDYVSAQGNWLGIHTNYIDADFYDAPNNNFQEFQVGPEAFWQLTGKTRLRFKAGYQSREFDDNSATGQADYDGIYAQAVGILKASNRLKINASVYREVSNLADDIAEYAVVQGFRVEPVWKYTSKISLRASLGYEVRDFQGEDPTNISVLPDREDDVTAAAVWVDWMPNRAVVLSVGYDTGKRDSNRVDEDYRYESLQLRVKAGF